MYMYTAKRCAADSAQCQPRYTYIKSLRTETHFQVVSRQAQAQVQAQVQAQAQVQGNKQTKKRQTTADDIRA